MWNRLSIKWQLILFMSIVVTLVELSTLYVVLKLQKEQYREIALKNVDAISKSLNNDFLKVILNPTTDSYADISYRLNAFHDVTGTLLINDLNQTIYQNGQTKELTAHKNLLVTKRSYFTDSTLYVRKDLILDKYLYGYILMDIDLAMQLQKHSEVRWTIIKIFPFALLLGFILSFILGANYTKPFKELLNAMRKSDPSNEQITLVTTSAKNEIQELYTGYNNLMTQVMDASKELHFQAEHDAVTGIKNRFFMEKALAVALKEKKKRAYTLLYIHFEEIRIINNTVGYQAADQLLKMITTEYRALLPQTSLFAKVDGFAFMVLLEDLSQFDYELFIEKSLQKLKDFRFTWETKSYSVSATIGVVMFKPFQYTLNELTKAVGSAEHHARAQGNCGVSIFNPDDDLAKRYDEELDTASFIKEALLDGPSRFELFAQDIVPLQYETEQISYEILIRMWDKDNNFIPPDNFLPTAQRYQQMHEIDIWVLWNYLQNVTQHPQHLAKLHSAHINLAGSSLTHPLFQAKVKEAVTHFNFPWSKLELEVTETSAVGNFTQANEFILWLKNVGIGLALDDFGTGMASFEYLKSMPFDVVKIDGSFVKDMHTDPIDKAVIKYIHEITELKGQETVAEYVETQEDVDALREIGITYGQGYFLGKPRPLQEWL